MHTLRHSILDETAVHPVSKREIESVMRQGKYLSKFDFIDVT
jgi:hypothetical protein